MLNASRVLSRRLINCSIQKCVHIAGCSSVSKQDEPTRNEGKTEGLEQKNSRKQELIQLQNKIKEFDEFSEQFLKELPNLPDDDELRKVFGSTLIRDPSKKLTIEQMESEKDRTSREPNKFRKIVYDEGELDQSDLSMPPSPTNPHPFDPETLPPSHARSIIAYVNHFPVLQRLVDLGVNLYEIDLEPKLGQQFLRLNLNKDLKPRLWFLAYEIGIDKGEIGSYLTRNPYFLLQPMEEIWKRVNYLRNKKFNSDQVKKIVVASRYWLNTDVKIIDSRLGWLQRQFQLTGNNLRALLVKEPRILIFGTGPIQRLLLAFNNDFEFEAAEIKKMMLEDPRLFMSDLEQIRLSYNYLHTTMNIDNELIADFPLALRCSIADIRKRNEFLKRLKLNQYNPELPHYISLRKLLHSSDRYFSETVCKKFLYDYENFLKTL